MTDMFVTLTCVSTIYFADKNALKGTLTDTLKEAQGCNSIALKKGS